MAVTFVIEYSIYTEMTVDELWPDGDAPENPKPADVEALINDCGGWDRIINDWCLRDDATTSVEKLGHVPVRRCHSPKDTE